MIERIFKSISIVSLTAVFGIGGFYTGSRGQVVEIIVPGADDSAVYGKADTKNKNSNTEPVKSNKSTDAIKDSKSIVPDPKTVSDSGSDKKGTIAPATQQLQNIVSNPEIIQNPKPETKVS